MGLYRGLFKETRRTEYTDQELFKRYIKRIAPYKKSVTLISFFILISTVADILIPLIFGIVVSELEQSETNFWIILIAGFYYLILSSLMWIMFSLRRRQVGKFVPFFLEDLRMDVFDKLQEQDMSFYDKYLSGNLNSRISNDTLDFGNTTILLTDTVGNLLISLLTFGILFWLNPVLALITILGIPVLFLLMFSLRKLARRISRAYRISISNVNSSMVEAIEGIQVCKSYGQEITVSKKFKNTNEEYFRNAFRLTAVTHVWRSVLDSITAIILVTIIFLGEQQIVQGVADTAVILIYILYVQRFFQPIMVLATFFPELSAGMAAYERILEIIDSEPNIQQNAISAQVETIRGEIEFKDVDFFYRAGEYVLKDFNLKIKNGEKLAIVGHTGAGKSSLVKLLARFYEFQSGTINIDGHNIRNLKLESYRKNVGIVLQDVFLFSGTIEENIRYGNRDATKEELLKAIEAVHLGELIEYLPNGLQTQVGERGRGLSAGQRQIISFACALISNPSILILDEATSSVDAYTEAIIQEALDTLLTGRTSIIIAHRLSTILKTDRIIVMEKGKIIEEGTHQSLITKNGKYGTLYNQYYEHQSLD
ncbi:MAG: ABC transporter ATP-binding protein [Candidatus Kariarchaeaceae archaeon]|jgi:ABC-type multidrug transport system fused ATPase/permease subunit